MTLPPGRARLAIRPAPTGSPELAITMGMVVVARLAANADPVDVTTIRSTLRRTNSAASSGRRSAFPSANRYSMTIFFPSIHPSLLSSCRNASTRTALPEAVLAIQETYPRKIFPDCCASATAPATTSMKAITESPNHFGFWIADFRLSETDTFFEETAFTRLFSCVSIQNLKSKIQNVI